MSSQFANLFLVVLFPFAGLFLGMIFRRIRRNRTAISTPLPDDVCECGYLLKKLNVPRCPECGRVIGFRATAEELGLSTAELEKIYEAQRRRKRGKDA